MQMAVTSALYHTCSADIGFGDTDIYRLRWYSLKIFPRFCGHGVDSYGRFTAEAIEDSVIDGSTVSVSYKRVYTDINLVVSFFDILPFPITSDLLEVTSDWLLENNREGWSPSGQSSGSQIFKVLVNIKCFCEPLFPAGSIWLATQMIHFKMPSFQTQNPRLE